MKYRFCVTLYLLAASFVVQAEDERRAHAYAFDQPETLAAQRVFGIGNAVIMLGEVCADDPSASASYAQWLIVNGETFKQIMLRLADYYRISNRSENLQQRVAATMHLKSRLSLSDATRADACSSLSDTLALPSMDLDKRYQAVFLEVKNPDYLKPKRQMVPSVNEQPIPTESVDEPEKPEEPEEPEEPEDQTRSD